jgi:hypothetical protein
MTFFKQEPIIESKNSLAKTREETVQLLDLPPEILFKIATNLTLPHLIALRRIVALNAIFFDHIFKQDIDPIAWFRYLQLINFANQQLFYKQALQYKDHIVTSLQTNPNLQSANHIALLLPIANQSNPHLEVCDELFNELIPPITVQHDRRETVRMNYIVSLTLSLIPSLSPPQIDRLFLALIDKKNGLIGYNYGEKIKLYMALLPRLNREQIAKIPVNFYLKKIHQFKKESNYYTDLFISTMNFLVYLSTKFPELNINVVEHFEYGKHFKEAYRNKRREALLSSVVQYAPAKVTELLNNLLSRLEHKNRHERKTAWVTLPLLVPYLKDHDVRSTLAVANEYLDNQHKHVKEAGLNILSALIPKINDNEVEHLNTKVRDKLNVKGELVRRAALNTAASLTKRLPEELRRTYLQPILDNLDSENIFVRLAALNASVSLLDQFDTNQIEILFKEFTRNLNPENLNILKKILHPIALASRFNEEQTSHTIAALLTLLNTPKSRDEACYLNQMIHDALIILLPQLSLQQHSTIVSAFKTRFQHNLRDKHAHLAILNTIEKQALFITDSALLMEIISFIHSIATDATVHRSTKTQALSIYTKLKLDPGQIYIVVRECLLPILAEPILREHAIKAISVLVTSLNMDLRSDVINNIPTTLVNLMSASDSKALDTLLRNLPDKQLAEVPNILKSNATKKNASWKSWGVLIHRFNPSQLEEIWDYCVEHINDENRTVATNVFNYLTLCIPILNDRKINLLYEILRPKLKTRVTLFSDDAEQQAAMVNTLRVLTPKLTQVQTDQVAAIYLNAIKDWVLAKEDWDALSALAMQITNKQLIVSILDFFLQAAGDVILFRQPSTLRFNVLNSLLPKLEPEQLIRVLNADYRENLQELSNTLAHFIMSGKDQGNALMQVISEQKSTQNMFVQASLLTLSDWFGVIANTPESENDLEELELSRFASTT